MQRRDLTAIDRIAVTVVAMELLSSSASRSTSCLARRDDHLMHPCHAKMNATIRRTDMRFDLDRFKTAQDAHGTYARALGELSAGHKTSHWIWFVFPQLDGLGSSRRPVTI